MAARLFLAALLAAIGAAAVRKLAQDWRRDHAAIVICLDASPVSGELPRRTLPALPDDGAPLSDEPGGEAEQFAALIYAYRAEAAPEHVYNLEPGDLS